MVGQKTQDTGTGGEMVGAAGCVVNDGGLAHRNGIRDGEGCLAFRHKPPVEVTGLPASWL